MEHVIDALFADGFFCRRRSAYRGDVAFSYLLCLSPGMCRARLNAQALLVRHGLVSMDDDGVVKVNGRLKRLTHSPDLFDPALPKRTGMVGFRPRGAGRDHVESLVRGALAPARLA